jgi:TonB family protein
MSDTLKIHMMDGTPIHDYPAEKVYIPWGAIASISLHLAVGGIILWIAYLGHVRSLRDLMTASIPQMPQDQLDVLLIDEKKEPPPTDNPLWIKQLIIPKVKPPPPPPPPPKPKPKPQQIHFVQKLSVGSHSLPTPTYPMEALRNRIQGTVLMRVSFDGSGGVVSAEVASSSGSGVLDNETRHFILSNWHEADMAGQTQTVPIQYVLPH